MELQSGMEIHCKSIGKRNTKLYNERFTSLQLLEKQSNVIQSCWYNIVGKAVMENLTYKQAFYISFTTIGALYISLCIRVPTLHDVLKRNVSTKMVHNACTDVTNCCSFTNI